MSLKTQGEVKGLTRRPRIFHGWWIVSTSFVSDFFIAGVGSHLLAVMLTTLQEALGVGRGVLALGQTTRAFVSALLGPIVGPFVDKPGGAKTLFLIGTTVGGLSLVLVSIVNTGWQFLLVFGVIGGFSMMSSGHLVGQVLIAKWFIKKRGRATSLAAMGIALSGVIIVPVSQYLMDMVGWRMTWVILGSIAWIVVFPLGLIFIKTNPEDIGLAPDGIDPKALAEAPAQSASSRFRPSITEAKWTRSQALRTPTLWILIIVFNFAGAEFSGILLHQKSYIEDLGLGTQTGIWTLSLLAFSSMIGKPLWGFISDFIEPRWGVMACQVVTAIGIILYLNISNEPSAYLAAIVYGVGHSGMSTLQSVVWANYYGRTFLGSIRGIVAPFQLLSNAGGPVMAGLIFDFTGTYHLAFLVFLGFAIAAAGLVTIAKPPQKAFAN